MIIEKDTIPEERQFGIVDKDGRASAFTGQNCLDWAGHKTAPYVTVQGNILVGPEVIDTMLAVFQKTRGPLAERLLAALEAGEAVGGDKRGKQSAAILVVRIRGGYDGVDDRLIDFIIIGFQHRDKLGGHFFNRFYVLLAHDSLNGFNTIFDLLQAFGNRNHISFVHFYLLNLN